MNKTNTSIENVNNKVTSIDNIITENREKTK